MWIWHLQIISYLNHEKWSTQSKRLCFKCCFKWCLSIWGQGGVKLELNHDGCSCWKQSGRNTPRMQLKNSTKVRKLNGYLANNLFFDRCCLIGMKSKNPSYREWSSSPSFQTFNSAGSLNVPLMAQLLRDRITPPSKWSLIIVQMKSLNISVGFFLCIDALDLYQVVGNKYSTWVVVNWWVKTMVESQKSALTNKRRIYDSLDMIHIHQSWKVMNMEVC